MPSIYSVISGFEYLSISALLKNEKRHMNFVMKNYPYNFQELRGFNQ